MRETRAVILIALLLPATALGAPDDEPRAPAPAASRPAAHQVIRVDGRDITVDLGTEDAGGVPATLRVYRVETIRHPATGSVQRSRILLGRLARRHPGDRFSIMRATGALATELRVGDVVEPEPATPPARPADDLGAPAPPPPSPVWQPAAATAPTLVRRGPARPWQHDTPHRLSVGGRYVSYGGANDQYGQAEADYSYTLRIPVLRALRFAGGAIAGRNPLVDPRATGSSFEDVRFYYGLVEVELELNDWLGLTNAVILGVNNSGVGGGWLGGLRIGHVDGVNLRAGGLLRSFVGHQASLGLEVPVGRLLKLTPRVLVENLLRGSDWAFRAELQAELRLARGFGLLGTIGGGARDVLHGGVNASLGLATYF